MALQHQVILSHPINKENQAACAILDGGVNYLVEGRSEGLEADGAIKHIRVDPHTNPIGLPVNDRFHRLPAAPFGPLRPHHRASLRPSAPVGENSGLRGSPAAAGLVWAAVLALPLLAPGSGGGGRVVVGVVEGELGHGFLRNCCGRRGRGRGWQMGGSRRGRGWGGEPPTTVGLGGGGAEMGELPWISPYSFDPFPFSLKTQQQNKIFSAGVQMDKL